VQLRSSDIHHADYTHLFFQNFNGITGLRVLQFAIYLDKQEWISEMLFLMCESKSPV